jgi:hypothetical protein
MNYIKHLWSDFGNEAFYGSSSRTKNLGKQSVSTFGSEPLSPSSSSSSSALSVSSEHFSQWWPNIELGDWILMKKYKIWEEEQGKEENTPGEELSRENPNLESLAWGQIHLPTATVRKKGWMPPLGRRVTKRDISKFSRMHRWMRLPLAPVVIADSCEDHDRCGPLLRSKF